MVRELKLAEIKISEQVNKFVEEVFIPKFNAKYGVVLAKRGNVHRQLTEVEKEQLDQIFSRQEVRYVNGDFTVRYQNKWFQLLEKQPILVRKKRLWLKKESLEKYSPSKGKIPQLYSFDRKTKENNRG